MYRKRQRKQSAERKAKCSDMKNHMARESERERERHTQTGCLIFAIFIPWLIPFLRPDYSTFSWVLLDIPHFLSSKFPIWA